MLPSRPTAALAAAVAVVAFAACTDDEESREDYAERLDEICRDVESSLGALDTTRVESPREGAALIDDVISESRRAVRRLDAVERPGGDAGDDAERFVRTLEREVEDRAIPALEDLRDAISARNPLAADRAGARVRELESSRSDRQARELGAEACAG
jgi:hypothetical protein